MMNATLRGKPDAGNLHVRFDEGEVASAKPRRGSLLYKTMTYPSLSRFVRRAGIACAAVGLSSQALATAYTWSASVAEGDWTAPTSWTAGSGYPASSSDTAKFSSATATVNIDAATTIGSVADTFNGSDVKFVGGKTLTINGSSWNIMKSAKIDASGSGTKVLFSGDGCKYVYGSNNRLRASDGGCIEVRGFKPGTKMWDLTTNLPSNMSVEAEGEGSTVILRTDNNTEGIGGAGFAFSAKDGGKIEYGLGRTTTKYCKSAIFTSKNASVVLDNGSFVMGYTGFSMSTDYAGQSIELKGAKPLLNAATYVTIGNGGAGVTLKFVPESGWADLTTARIVSGTTATLGADTALVVDGSALGAVAGTKRIPLVYGKTDLAFDPAVTNNATVTGFASSVKVSFETASNTLYLKLESNLRAVAVPMIEGVTYDGQKHTAVVPASDDYTVTTLPTDVVDAGDYDVVLTLTDPDGTIWADDGTATPKTLKYTIAKAENSWTTAPALSKTEWEYGATPAEVTAGVAKSGDTAVVTYDAGLTEMPVTVGAHKAVFTVAEGKNYKAIVAEIPYAVTLKANSWVVEPSLSKTTWATGGEPATVTPGEAASGVATVVTYDGSLTEMPTEVGVHTAVFTVPEGNNYAALVKTLPFVITGTEFKQDVGLAAVALSGYDGNETLTNFPVLVRLSEATVPGLNIDLMSEDGADVRAYDLDGNELAFEVESWNRGGESLIWVKVPELKPVSEGVTSVLVGWGKTGARTTAAKDVWTEYAAVWHMNDTATLGEAAGNGYNLTGATRTLKDGPVGKAIQHSAAMSMADFVQGETGIGENYTLSCWYKYPNGGQFNVFTKGTWTENGRWYTQHKSNNTTMQLIRDYGVKATISTKNVTTAWNYHAVVNNGGTMYAVANDSTALTSFGKLNTADDQQFSVDGNGLVDELRIKKSVSSAAWMRAECRSQTGALTTSALVQNPVLGDVIVLLSAETAPTVNNDRVLTIPYRVTSTGGSAVTVNALYAIEGDATTNTVVIGTAAEAQTEDATGTVGDLCPGTNYVFAICGTNAFGRASAVSAWQTVAVPGAPEIRGLVVTQTKDKVTLSGVVVGAGTKTAVLRYAFDGGELTEEAELELDANGAFSVTLDRTSVLDVLKYQIAVTSNLVSPKWGTFDWNVETPVLTAADAELVTYTWKGGASGVWADPANWEPSVASCYGYPNSKNYAKAKFTAAAAVDLEDGTFGIAASGLVVGSNLGEVKLRNGAIDVPYDDFGYGASGTTVVFDNVTIKGQRGLKFVSGSTVVFAGDTAQGWVYEPWGVNNTKMVVRDGEMSSGYFQTWFEADRRHEVEISNAVWTINGKAAVNVGVGCRTSLVDGADRQARLVSAGPLTLSWTWALTIPEKGHKEASIVAKSTTGDSAMFEVDVTNYKRGIKVPLVRFTGADQSDVMAKKACSLTAYADGVDVTEDRNARLEWSAKDNTLYYVQDAEMGLIFFVK